MIGKVGVIGAGIMGHGIAEVMAVAGHEVTILDVSEEILQNAKVQIKWSLENLERSGKLQEGSEKVLSRLSLTTNYSDLAVCDLVLEAVKEDTKIKGKVFGELRKVLPDSSLVASNTSTIPITELAALYGRERNFVGIHFSNPPIIMPIVEIISGDQTSEVALKMAEEFVESIGKETVIVKKDVPGFLINRLNDRTILETITMLEDGYGPEVVDGMARYRLGFPMGMCELLDFVGIDTVYYANREMVSRGFNSRESGILKDMVGKGRIGSKSGEGFYSYPKAGKYSRPNIHPSEEVYEIDPLRLLAPAINEAAWLLRNEVCSKEDIEKAMKLAMNWPHGPLEYADRYGVDNVVRILKERLAATGESRYEPDQLLKGMFDKGLMGYKTGEGFSKHESESRKFGAVLYTLVNDYALVEFNRPDKLNSLDENTWTGLKDALVYAERDERVRSVVVTGKGKAFCAGDDIAMMDSWKEEGDARKWMEEYAEPLINTIQGYSKPIISAVNGIAFGGGCELNILFDIVLADEDAVFAIPEGLIGAMPPIATSLGFALINRKFARYALTGEWFSAEQAKELGLVDVVVPEGQLSSAICEFTGKISRSGPLSTKSVKIAVNNIREMYNDQSNLASDELVKLAATEDFKEGQRAFLRKKLPEWKGR